MNAAEPQIIILASTGAADAVAIRVAGTPRRPGDGRHRRVVAYCASDVLPSKFALLLRELADALDPPRPKSRRRSSNQIEGAA
jgi:hypothetical protein